MTAGVIEASDLVKVYRGGTRALDRVSFSVDRGEIFALLGPNGSGKTTTVKILTTQLRPTDGVAVVDGHDPVRQPDAVRRAISVVFQDPSVDDELTVAENMEFHAAMYDVPRAARTQRTAELLRLVDLSDRKDDLVGTLSGGLKRRLELARALLHRPKILFLDEPTLGLDPQTRRLMWSTLMETSADEGTTIFFTTHYMEEADRAAKRIAILDGGRIAATGTAEDLKTQTQSATLEDAFLALTGKAITDEPVANRQPSRFGHGPGMH